MRYQQINTELFEFNRKRFAQKMQPDSMAIFHSNDRLPRSGDTFFPFKQNSDLFYLSGLDQEETVVVIFPDCVKEGFHELAFINRPNEKSALWEGSKYSKEQARSISGIQKIYFLDEMDIILRELILLAKRIYVNDNEHEHFASEIPSRNARLGKKLMEQYPFHKYHRAQPILKKLGMIKSHHEVELLQKAIEITKKGFERAVNAVRPGMKEYEIEAEITYEFIKNGANGHAYDPIIASGPNSCVLHYSQNNSTCKEGDLILMDFGAEYAHYSADITRTIPVSGHFTDRQKAVYEAVYNVLIASREQLVPGKLLDDFNSEVGLLIQKELINLNLLDPAVIEANKGGFPLYKKYFMHSASHHLGRDVHDAASRFAPIQAGMVFTLEPAIYIPEEKIGIRLENIILVTDQGPIDLTANIPLALDEIETMMKQEVFN
ncbi:MAG: aminopeptidase P family protein [Bacteroidota bacterium]